MSRVRPRRLIVRVVLALALAAVDAGAQSLEVGIGGTGTVSLQLTDGSNAFRQYRDEPIGGWGTGFGVFLTAISGSGLTIAGEFTRSKYSVEHSDGVGRSQHARSVAGKRVSRIHRQKRVGNGQLSRRRQLGVGEIGAARF